MKYRNIYRLLALLLLAINLPLSSYSQCKGFAKKKCIPQLTPFIHNGQLNSTTLAEGESAELVMTFYSGQQYRILVCGQKNLGKIEFQLMDTDRNVIFDSKKHKSASYWDFDVNATQQFIILVTTPKQGKHSSAKLPGTLVQSGCVALLVGFKN